MPLGARQSCDSMAEREFTTRELAVLLELHRSGPMDKLLLRRHLGMSNRQLKVDSATLKLGGWLNCKTGQIWLTPKGIKKIEDAYGLAEVPF